ncbi:MAG: hypothetical protein ACTSRY_06460 [Alphaproteobacteria bacterium]
MGIPAMPDYTPPIDHALAADSRGGRLLARLPAPMRAGLDDAAVRAIATAAAEDARIHGIDLRLSLGPFYFVVLSGRERRSPARLARDRARHALRRLGNALFLAGIVSLMLIASLIGALFYGAVLE